MQAGEPGDVIKEKLLDGLEVSLWDRWEVHQDGTLTQVITTIEEKYPGLEVRDIMRGNTPLYFHAIMTAPGKESEKKEALGSSVRKLTESEQEDYVDLNITCVRKDDPEHKIIKGVPPVRVWFKTV
jgi:Ubiquitin fold domain